MGLQVAFLIAVPGTSSFVTLGSIGVSFLSFVFAVFAKRNLRDGINADGDDADPAGSSSDTELTVAPNDDHTTQI